MVNKFYIADLHFFHKNILAFDNRPFKSVEDMNESLINIWNTVVSNADLVYILGDMFWCNSDQSIPILDRLNGNKFLICGNHDRTNDSKFKQKFVKICDYDEIEDNGRHIVLSHYPIPCFKNHFYGWYHLYGHVHTSFEYNMMQYDKYLLNELYGKPCNMYNVGAMVPYMNYTPRTLDYIIENGDKNDETRA